MTDSTHHLCGCGHEFEDDLGAFGCPNCEGDDGPAIPQPPEKEQNP